MDPNDVSAAKQAAFRLLKFRPRSEHELRSRLLLRGFSLDVIGQTVDLLKRTKMIDDEMFARLWAQSRLRQSIGFSRIRFELKNKGVAKAYIERALSQMFDSWNEREVVRDVAVSRLSKMKDLEPKKARLRLFGFLRRRGFSADIVTEVLRDLTRDKGQEWGDE